MNVTLKVGRNDISVDEKDILMDNGCVIQFLTKEAGSGWNSYPMKMSQKLFKDLKKFNLIYTNSKLKESAEKYGVKITLYKFDIEKMIEFGYK